MSRTVVVTGCSSGFGREVSERLARQGDRVYATMRGVEGKNAEMARAIRALAAAAQIDLRVLEMDVTSTASVDAAAATVLAESGAPDVVINNAGQMFIGFAEAFTADEVAKQLDVNVVGIHRVTRAFLPAMRARGRGLIINLSSVAGRIGAPFNGVYHASKWAVEGYSLALRRELASSGIDVVVVEPGPFATALFPTMRTPEDKDGRVATYPEAAHQAFAGLGAAFEGIFKDPAGADRSDAGRGSHDRADGDDARHAAVPQRRRDRLRRAGAERVGRAARGGADGRHGADRVRDDRAGEA